MSIQEKAYWVALGQIQRFGPIRFKKLINFFPTIQDAWFSNRQDLLEAGIESDLIDDFFIKRQNIAPQELWEKLGQENIQVVTIQDVEYPAILKEIYDPPAFLYYKGALSVPDEFCLAVVGTRKMSQYGRQVCQEIVRDLASQGLTIVSGLALGIDSMAHTAALEAGARTIAVLGSGLDQASIYPHTNRRLAQKIIEQGGAVVSEFPLGMLPLKHNFPIRNRIISGLSLGTLVIEADEGSGSLITAKSALDQNREVFAVPGPIYSQTSIGTNQLIKMGGKLTSSANDVLESLNLNQIKDFIKTQEIVPDSPEEENILKHLSKEPAHIDAIIRKSGLAASQVSCVLATMEMKGKIRDVGGMNYVLAR
ncbi:DNA-processing protein DprA [Patescibacteria group bacterium]|nr:DNA-processing protein DprA [Patescibacteria group bacterium]MBU1921880.1 DNA-processing protein DprA [Patescibacteria group bacterium]